MRFTRWTNQSLPQTLQYGMFFLYFDAVFGLLFGRAFTLFPLGLLLTVGAAFAGLGIANEFRWGWRLGVAVSAIALLPVALVVLFDGPGELFSIRLLANLVFPVAQFLLLVHPQSREHQRIWFS